MGVQFLEDIATFTRGQAGHGAHRYTGSRQLVSDAPAGAYVVPTDDGKCDPPSSAAQVAQVPRNGGVLEYLADRIANSNGLEYAADDYAQIIDEGHVVGITEEAVDDQDDVYVRFSAKGANTQLGALRTGPDADTAGTLVLNNTLTSNTNITIDIDGETFTVATGAGGTSDSVATEIATAIDASASFTASATGSDVSVTRADGEFPGEINLDLPVGVTDTSGKTCARLPGARFVGDAPSGLAMVRLY